MMMSNVTRNEAEDIVPIIKIQQSRQDNANTLAQTLGGCQAMYHDLKDGAWIGTSTVPPGMYYSYSSYSYSSSS